MAQTRTCPVRRNKSKPVRYRKIQSKTNGRNINKTANRRCTSNRSRDTSCSSSSLRNPSAMRGNQKGRSARKRRQSRNAIDKRLAKDVERAVSESMARRASSICSSVHGTRKQRSISSYSACRSDSRRPRQKRCPKKKKTSSCKPKKRKSACKKPKKSKCRKSKRKKLTDSECGSSDCADECQAADECKCRKCREEQCRARPASSCSKNAKSGKSEQEFQCQKSRQKQNPNCNQEPEPPLCCDDGDNLRQMGCSLAQFGNKMWVFLRCHWMLVLFFLLLFILCWLLNVFFKPCHDNVVTTIFYKEGRAGNTDELKKKVEQMNIESGTISPQDRVEYKFQPVSETSAQEENKYCVNGVCLRVL